MKTRGKRITKEYPPKLSTQIFKAFEKRGGVYPVGEEKKVRSTNLYDKIKRCDRALLRIRKLLRLADYDLDYEIRDLKKEREGQKKV